MFFLNVRRIDEEHNYKEKNVYFSNMKKIIKHYPMTDRLIVTRGYEPTNVCIMEKLAYFICTT
jgi:hypothetical protein